MNMVTNFFLTTAKAGVKKIFRMLGFVVTRIQPLDNGRSPKYFNTGSLSPIEENSVAIYDKFYGDADELDFYYNQQDWHGKRRLDFFAGIADLVKDKGINLNRKRVLDVGCGTGHLLEAVIDGSTPKSAQGCDFSPVGVEHAKKYFPKYTFFVHDIGERLPNKCNVIFCTEVLEHLGNPSAALRNILRGLEPDGVAILTVPNGRKDQLTEHINFWSPESWVIFIQDNCGGFSIDTGTIFDDGTNYAVVRNGQ